MTPTELKTILTAHAKWLADKGTGSRAYLSRANLSRADLSGADLSRADLSGANLSRAYLSRANLSRADLSGADLSGADLSGANLSGANLSRADLSSADLSGANLSSAYLSRAYLSGANLSRANLSGAYLSRADLSSANLTKATLPPLSILPEGDIIGWKKLHNNKIAKLSIPSAAARVNSTGRKCRAEFAIVLEIRDSAGNKCRDGISSHNNTFKYQVGETVRPDKFDPDFRVECSSGIHFFITRDEAVTY